MGFHCTLQTVASTDGTCDEEELAADSTQDRLLDTVGAVAVDWQGHVVSAVSSGGIVLKQPGRLGQVSYRMHFDYMWVVGLL